MFLLILEYKVDLTEVDRHAEAHIAWLRQCYASGDFVVSGRQVLRTGGVILARGERCRIESLIASDPFTIHDVADYRVIEFAPAMAAPGLEALLA